MKKHIIPRRMFYRILWPSLISALALSIADIADALVVGNRVGETGLAAIGIVTPLYMLFNLIGYGFSTGGSVMHGRLSADGKLEAVQAHFRTLCLWLMEISVCTAVLGNLLLTPILYLLGVGASHPELLAMCSQYARPMLTATPIFMLNFLLYDFVRCDNDPELASLGFSLGCITDLGLNILLVLVLNMGVRGAILSTIAAQTLSVLIMVSHFFNGQGVLTWRKILTGRQENIQSVCVNSLKIGFSTSVRYILQFLFLAMGNRLLMMAGSAGHINGALYVAIFDLVMNVSYVAMSVYQAVSDTMQPLVSIFSAEHDEDNLQYVLKLSLYWGIVAGTVVSALLALFAGPVSCLFGMPDAVALSVPAICIFCLSTPFAGIQFIQIRYDQSCGYGMLAGIGTMLRTAVLLLPVTLVLGLFAPAHFWWLFPITEVTGCVVMQFVRTAWLRRHVSRTIPVFSDIMDNDNHDLGRVMERLVGFCDANEIGLKQATQIQLAVEELCLVTLEKAFTGQKDEYIQLTLVLMPNEYILHIRNSAPYFNPLDMRMGKIRQETEEDIMDSMGVMMVRKKARDLQYRNYEGCNVLTVIF